MHKLCLAVVVLSLLAGPAAAGALDPELSDILARSNPAQFVTVIVSPARQADLSDLPADAGYDAKVDRLKAGAAEGQAPILEFLAARPVRDVQSFWLASRIAVAATPSVIRELAERPDVALVAASDTVWLDTDPQRGAARSSVDAPIWNIARVNAPAAWTRGYTGSGVVVGNIDTGCEVTHPALGGRWRSTDGWFDAVNGQAVPYDNHYASHGTHTMGTICGGDGPGPYVDDIGVAPGCTFISAKAFGSDGSGAGEDIMAALDWMAGTGRPDVLSNSWGTSSSTDTTYLPHIRNLRALGVVVVFSIGNDGPGRGSARAPGNFPYCISVGAVDSADAVADFSSRGPAPSLPGWNDCLSWSRPDWDLVCPTVAAPGVGIVSAMRGDSLGRSMGTSMACPHVAGCAALLLDADPTLTHDDVFWKLTESAEELHGLGYPNNDYGWGMLDCNAALDVPRLAAAPWVRLDSARVVNDGNGNGVLEPGEAADVRIWITNWGTVGATGLTATLTCGDEYVTVLDPSSAFGSLAARTRADNASDPLRASVAANCPAGRSVTFNLAFHAAEGDWSAEFLLLIGQVGSRLWGLRRLTGLYEQQSVLATSAVAYHPFEDRLYAVCGGILNIKKYSADSTATLLDSIPTPLGSAGCSDIDFSAVDTTFWVHVRKDNQESRVVQIRPDGTVLRNFLSPAGSRPFGLAWDDVERRLYLSHWASSGPAYLWVMDTAGRVTDTMLFPTGPAYTNRVHGLAIDHSNTNPRGRTLAVVHVFNGTSRIDSSGIWEYSLDDLTMVNRFKFSGINYMASGLAWDSRDGSFWVTFDHHMNPYHQAGKFTGFHPVIGVEEPGRASLPGRELRGSPNPSRGRVRFTLPGTAARQLSLYSADGRLVRRLALTHGEATWDGRDDAGIPAPPGVYVAHSGTASIKVVRR